MKKVLLSILLSFSLLFTIVNAQSSTAFTYPMNVGSTDASTGGQVTKLQEVLNKLDLLNVDPTGYFGQLTKNAVMKFQAMQGFEQVGNVGPLTRKALSSQTFSNSSYNNNTNYSGSLGTAIPSSASANPAPNNISISFTSLDETVVLNIPYNSILNLPNLSPRSKFPGYTFSGWYTNTSYTSTYQKTPVISPVYFYAKWTKTCSEGNIVVFPMDCDVNNTNKNQSEAQTKQCLINGVSVTVSASLDCSKLTNNNQSQNNQNATSSTNKPQTSSSTNQVQNQSGQNNNSNIVDGINIDILNWPGVKRCETLKIDSYYQGKETPSKEDKILKIPSNFNCPSNMDNLSKEGIYHSITAQSEATVFNTNTQIYGAYFPCVWGPYLYGQGNDAKKFLPNGRCPKPSEYPENSWLLNTEIINIKKGELSGGSGQMAPNIPDMIRSLEYNVTKYYPVPASAIPSQMVFDENGNILINGGFSGAPTYTNAQGIIEGGRQIAKETYITIESPYIRYKINAIVPLDSQKIKLSNYITEKTLFGYTFDGLYTDFYYVNEYAGYDKSMPNILFVKDSYATYKDGNGYSNFNLYAKWSKKCDDGKIVVWPNNCFRGVDGNRYAFIHGMNTSLTTTKIGTLEMYLGDVFGIGGATWDDYIAEGVFKDKEYTQYVEIDSRGNIFLEGGKDYYVKWIQNCKDGSKVTYPKKCTDSGKTNVSTNPFAGAPSFSNQTSLSFKNDGTPRVVNVDQEQVYVYLFVPKSLIKNNESSSNLSLIDSNGKELTNNLGYTEQECSDSQYECSVLTFSDSGKSYNFPAGIYTLKLTIVLPKPDPESYAPNPTRYVYSDPFTLTKTLGGSAITFKDDGSSRIFYKQKNAEIKGKILLPFETKYWWNSTQNNHGKIWIVKKDIIDSSPLASAPGTPSGWSWTSYVSDHFGQDKLIEAGSQCGDPACYIRGNTWFEIKLNNTVPAGIYVARICEETRAAIWCGLGMSWSESDPFEIRD